MSPTEQPFDSNDEPGTGPGQDLLAAEYVLGVLDADARRAAQVRIGRDTAFAAEVAAWETRFAPWLEAIAPVPAPFSLWPRILAAIGSDPVEAGPIGAGNDNAQRSAPARPSLWDRLPFWRGLAAGGFAVAAASLSALFITARQLSVEPAAPHVPVVVAPSAAAMPMVVAIRHDDGTAAYSATVDPGTGVIVLMPVFMPDDSRVPELWLIPADGTPRSLGVVDRTRPMTVNIPSALRDATAADSVFAISLEPLGGSPTGQPTGPVVAKGNLIRL